jgi:hypothetical protein
MNENVDELILWLRRRGGANKKKEKKKERNEMK